ncbi:MAG: aromatic ring-hydroxylating dioxygenase subunit alpha [Betaproteobacteria bacterium]|nr:aromatic ring-hydroxylating dioxygenase subunit alpha [Betaproteobacteria bacterium]
MRMDFLRNAWYMAGWAGELAPGDILGRTLCGQPIVLYRGTTGNVGALEDTCCHRHYPLSASGSVVGSNLQCGYHGFQYDANGKCVKIPSQARIPENAGVRSYAVAHRHQCLWVWMGEAKQADLSAIPDLAFLDDPAWGWRGSLYPTKCNYRHILENLMDHGHLPFVHGSTIGNSAVIDQADSSMRRGEDDIQVNRWMIDTEAPPSYKKAAAFTDRVDRWQLIRYLKPSIVRLWTGAAPHGANAREKLAPHGAPEGRKLGGISFFNLNLVTPETERSTHYFWAHGQDLRPRDQSLTDLVFGQIDIAFKEDWALLEAQQVRIDQLHGRPRVDVGGDAGGIQAMELLDKAIIEEQRGRRAGS